LRVEAATTTRANDIVRQVQPRIDYQNEHLPRDQRLPETSTISARGRQIVFRTVVDRIAVKKRVMEMRQKMEEFQKKYDEAFPKP